MERHETIALLEAEVRTTLEQAGALGAFAPALEAAGLDALPDDPFELHEFLSTSMLEALVGIVHPTTAGGIVEELLARAERIVGGRRHSEPTLPPPPSVDRAGEDYASLATGVVHTRPTPVWGLRRSGEGQAPPALWLIVSSDPALLELARAHAPESTDVVAITSAAMLERHLTEGEPQLVLDGASTELRIQEIVAPLASSGERARVLMWRMDGAARSALLGTFPAARTWLALEAEVTAAEVVQLLGA